jgi:hypothetical protein
MGADREREETLNPGPSPQMGQRERRRYATCSELMGLSVDRFSMLGVIG